MIVLIAVFAYLLWPYLLAVGIAALVIGFLDARYFPARRREEPDLVGRLRREDFRREMSMRRSRARERLGRRDPGT